MIWLTNSHQKSFNEDYELIDNEIFSNVKLEFGTLHQCKRKYDGTLFAVKKITKSNLIEIANNSQETLQVLIKAIKHEIDTLIHLNHRYIVNIHETYETQTYLYIIIDECTGCQLYNKLIKQQRITEYECKYIIKQILTVLHYMDDQHLIIHCDLNMNNIFFVNPYLNNIKISNFCMSQILPYLTNVPSKQMITSYTAPEILTNRNNYSHYSDMWSVGILTFIMIFGFEPFHSNRNDLKSLSKLIKNGFQNKIKVNTILVSCYCYKNNVKRSRCNDLKNRKDSERGFQRI